jgi:hypothetical protein
MQQEVVNRIQTYGKVSRVTRPNQSAFGGSDSFG